MPRRRCRGEVEKPPKPKKEKKLDSNEEDKNHAQLLALPPHGSEVFLDGIPHDATEEDLRRFCESIGEVTEVRIMKGKKSGENKGYAFVMFRTKELATKAMEKLNGTQLKGKKITCSSSQAKHKLVIGNIPRNWGEEDLRKVVAEVGPGVDAIELVKYQQNSSRNRGFAFIEYYNHACAEYARKKMSNSNFKLGDKSPTVSWADPTNAESSASSQAMFSTAHNNDLEEKEDLIAGKHKEVLAAEGEESVFDSSDQADSEEEEDEEEGYIYIPSDEEEILLWELHQADEKRERQKQRQSTVPLKEDFKCFEFGGQAIRVGSDLNVNRLYDSGMRSIQAVIDPFFQPAVPTPPPPPPYRPRLSFSTPSLTYPSTGHFRSPYHIPPPPPYRPYHIPPPPPYRPHQDHSQQQIDEC